MKTVWLFFILWFLKVCSSSQDNLTSRRNLSIFHNYRRSKIHHNSVHQRVSKLKTNQTVGKLANIKNYPFVACVITKTKTEEIFRGGAAIITNKWAITAAHCVQLFIEEDAIRERTAYVRSNTPQWNKVYSEHRIVKIYSHENYSFSNPCDYDIALVKVQDPFTGYREDIVKLAYKDYEYIDKSAAIIIGWGTTDVVNHKPAESDNLRYFEIKLVDSNACKKAVKETRMLDTTKRMMCAATSDKGACINISGGPLYQNWQLIGIMSWGSPSCAQTAIPGIYTKISVFWKWIDTKLKQKVERW